MKEINTKTFGDSPKTTTFYYFDIETRRMEKSKYKNMVDKLYWEAKDKDNYVMDFEAAADFMDKLAKQASEYMKQIPTPEGGFARSEVTVMMNADSDLCIYPCWEHLAKDPLGFVIWLRPVKGLVLMNDNLLENISHISREKGGRA